MSNRSSKGFTLIELLVVIAIIGILAALVLVALGNARQKANDARIQSNLGQLRTLAEVFYDANSASYQSTSGKSFATCVTTPSATNCAGGIDGDVTALKADNDIAAGASSITAIANGQNFCIESPLNSDTAQSLCIDGTGQSMKTTNATPCNATTYLCQ